MALSNAPADRAWEKPLETAGAIPPCPLCGRGRARSLRALTGAQLRRLWGALGLQLTPEAWGVISEETPVHLWRCLDCGFEYSDPALAGNARFYEEMQAHFGWYYPPSSPEFARAVRFARRRGLREVMDVGCGSGAFLDMARAAGLATHGLELNPQAAEHARRAGHQISSPLTTELLRQPHPPQFEFVTLWQVLEHVSDPAGFMGECARLVKPGGFLGVAVPMEDGMHRLCPWDPHLWPPHHVTRWRRKDLVAVGMKNGLVPVESGGDLIDGPLARHFFRLHNQLAGSVGARERAGDFMFSGLCWLFRRTGAHWIFPRRGASVFAFFSKP